MTIWTPDGEVGGRTITGFEASEFWSPDSTQLVAISSGKLVIFDRTGEIISEIDGADEDSKGSWQRIAP